MNDRLVMRPELRQLVGGVSSETIRRWIVSGRLPPPDYRPSYKTMGWLLSTLQRAGVLGPTASLPSPAPRGNVLQTKRPANPPTGRTLCE